MSCRCSQPELEFLPEFEALLEGDDEFEADPVGLFTELESEEYEQLTPNFKLSEFVQRDGTPVPDRYRSNVERLARNLQVLRSNLRRGVRITSGYRSPEYNRRIGGATRSQHLTAKAADIRVRGVTPRDVYCTIERLIKAGKMQQGGLGIYRKHVHYDIRSKRSRWKGGGVSRPSCTVRATAPPARGHARGRGRVTPASPGPAGPFGTLSIVTPQHLRYTYVFTPKDVLWTARFIVGEASGRVNADNIAVIWAMFNRYALQQHRRFPTFHVFLRRYSTPLQPVLRSWKVAKHHYENNPDFKRLDGYYAKAPDVPRGQLVRHLKLQKKKWSQLPAPARLLATRVLTGRVANPGIGPATDFASTCVHLRRKFRKEKKGRCPADREWRQFTKGFKRTEFKWIGHVSGINQKKNAFFTRIARIPGDATGTRYSDLPADTVRITPPG